MPKIRDLISLTVPSRLLLALGMFLIFSLLFEVSVNSIFFLAILVVAITDSSASVLNSISDVNTDKINRKLRPLAKGVISMKLAFLFFILLFVFSLTVSFFLSFLLLVAVIFRILFEIIYSFGKIKNVYPLNYIFTGLSYAVIPLFCVISIAENFSLKILLEPIFLFLILSVTFAPLKDVEDYKGDKELNVKTLSVLFNNNKVVTKILFLNLFILLLFFLYWLIIQSVFLFPSFFAIILLGNFYLFSKHINSSNDFHESYFTKLSMLLAVEICFVFLFFIRWLFV